MTESTFPGGSKSRINAAGAAVRERRATVDDQLVIEEWRSAHTAVINTFQALLRNRAKAVGAVVAQRLKRKATIFDKLTRLPKMELSRMDDVAGCRIIFRDVTTLNEFRRKLHEARFAHVLKNEPDKYDYIKFPKKDGYRGVHDIFSYQVNSNEGRHLQGLNIELQYRTLIQHTWSTTVEILSYVTGHDPKYHRGDQRYIEAMALASEMLARAFEGKKGPRPGLPDQVVASNFLALDEQLGLLLRLRALQVADKSKGSANRHFILMRGTGVFTFLNVSNYATAEIAKRELFRLEQLYPNADIVYVTGETTDAVRLAYKNYFDDAVEFLERLTLATRELGIIPPVLG